MYTVTSHVTLMTQLGHVLIILRYKKAKNGNGNICHVTESTFLAFELVTVDVSGMVARGSCRCVRNDYFFSSFSTL